jgi:hypothetical protein
VTDSREAHERETERRLGELESQYERVGATLRALTSSVADLTRVGGDRPAGSATGDAVPLPTGEELTSWVAWLIEHYELEEIPQCWPRHGGLVEEFDALRIAWLDSIGRGAGGLAAAHWHDALGRALGRIHDPRWARWRRCLDYGHQTPEPAPAADGNPAETIGARYLPPEPPELS